MYLADPKELMVFPEEDFAGRPLIGMTGGRLYRVREERLEDLKKKAYAPLRVRWMGAEDSPEILLRGEYVPAFRLEVGERPALVNLFNPVSGKTLWLAPGQGKVHVHAVTELTEPEAPHVG